MKWYHSIAAKSMGAAFVAIHIPLLTLAALVALYPQGFSPMSVLLAGLVATLLSTALVLLILWRLLLPLRTATDGLRAFMTEGRPLRLPPPTGDEVGMLVEAVARSLTHLDRSRAPLLQSGAITLERRAGGRQPNAAPDLGWVALLEVDQWAELDESAGIVRMQEVQVAMGRALAELVQPGELLLPWGRGRFLLALAGAAAEAEERLRGPCGGFGIPGEEGRSYTCSAALEARTTSPIGWASALQRVEHKLFAMRLAGKSAQVG